MNCSRALALAAALTLSCSTASAQTVSRPRIVGLAHAAFYVQDMAQAVAFYTDYLGYESPYSLPLPSGGDLVWIKINERQSVELFPEVKPGTDRLAHIAVETDDADAMRRYLRQRGLAVPDQTPVGKSGNKNFMIKDPDGNLIEIVEYLPTGWTAREEGRFQPAGRISTHLGHVGVKVGDLDSAIAFYRDVLGFRETYRQSADGRTLSWVNLQVPEGEDYVEFMLFHAEPSLTQLHTMHHICLVVDDILAAQRTLRARPLPPGCPATTGMKLGKNGRWQINCFDPDGTRVEVMEPDTFNGQPIPLSDAPPPVRHGVTPL
jgi:lactoylglutathione lyase